MSFPLRDKIMDGYPIKMKENRKYISDKKQITYIFIQNGIDIPVHLKIFRVWGFEIGETLSHFRI